MGKSNAPSYHLAADDRFHIVAVLQGAVTLSNEPLAKGQTALIPAACSATAIVPLEPSVVLDIYLPTI
jgi:hypothetical protein